MKKYAKWNKKNYKKILTNYRKNMENSTGFRFKKITKKFMKNYGKIWKIFRYRKKTYGIIWKTMEGGVLYGKYGINEIYDW